MQRISQLGYVGLGVSNLDAWTSFAEDILGMQRDDDEDASLQRFRIDEYRNRVLVYEAAQNDIAFAGWEVDDRQALYATAEQLTAAGITVNEACAGESEQRKVAEMLYFQDPGGLRCELYYGAHVAFERPFRSPRAIGGFVTGEQGLGHIVLTVQDLEEGMHFYRDLLGMRESDFITIERGGTSFQLGFLHCNRRHHTLALAELERPKRLAHLMLQVATLDDVGTTYELCEKHGVPIAATLGRHTNDHMVSFYMNSPAGFEIEYGWGARTVDDSTWKVQTHNAPSIWGHRRG